MRKKRIAVLAMALLSMVSLTACSLEEESSSGVREESPASQREATQEPSDSSPSGGRGTDSWGESALSSQVVSEEEPPEEVLSSQKPNETSLTLEDLQDSRGKFAYPGLNYGAPPRIALLILGLSPQQEAVDASPMSPERAAYAAGSVALEGVEFQRGLTFEEDALQSVSLTKEAAEGEDLAPLYQTLQEGLDALYGLGEERVVKDVTVLRGGGAERRYDCNRFQTVTQEDGETSTVLSLSCLERDGAVLEVSLELCTGP